MRVLIALLVIVALAGGGYTVFWHKKADEFKQRFVTSIDQINTHAGATVKGGKVISYDSINVTGFPSSMVVEITKPAIRLPLSEAVKKKGAATAPVPFDWVQEISWNGTIGLTTNINGNQYTLTSTGDSTWQAIVDGKPRNVINVSSSTPLVAHVASEKIANGELWTAHPILGNGREFLDVFRNFDWNISGLVLKDGTGATIYTLEQMMLSLRNDGAGSGNHKIAFKTTLNKAKSTPAFDAIAKDYAAMIFKLKGEEAPGALFPSWSTYGERTLKADITIDGPFDGSAMRDPGKSLHFDVNTLSLQSELFNMDFETHFAVAPQGEDRAVTLSAHSHSQVSPGYDKLMQQTVAAIFTELAKAEGKSESDKKMAKTISNLGAPADIAAIVTPRAEPLGKTAFDMDLNIKSPMDPVTFMKQGSATLDRLDWVSEIYGIKTKGTVDAKTQGAPPIGDLMLNCLSCDALIGDIGDWAMRVESVVDKAGLAPQTYITKDLIEGIKQFVHGVGESGSGKDVSIHLAAKDGGFTVSGKGMPEIMALYMNTIAPRMPRMQAPSDTLPEPSPGR